MAVHYTEDRPRDDKETTLAGLRSASQAVRARLLARDSESPEALLALAASVAEAHRFLPDAAIFSDALADTALAISHDADDVAQARSWLEENAHWKNACDHAWMRINTYLNHAWEWCASWESICDPGPCDTVDFRSRDRTHDIDSYAYLRDIFSGTGNLDATPEDVIDRLRAQVDYCTRSYDLLLPIFSSWRRLGAVRRGHRHIAVRLLRSRPEIIAGLSEAENHLHSLPERPAWVCLPRSVHDAHKALDQLDQMLGTKGALIK